jgi:hypothetical protein
MKGISFGNQPVVYRYEKSFFSIQIQILFDILKSRNFPYTLLKAIFDTHTKQSINKI